MLWEGMGFGWAEVGYSGRRPPARRCAARARGAGSASAASSCFPSSCSPACWCGGSTARPTRSRRAIPEIEFVKAGYLGDHPLVLDCFVERIEGIRAGDVNMNCLLCKYRAQVIGHEAAVGAPQEGHHHHVEGIGTDADPPSPPPPSSRRPRPSPRACAAPGRDAAGALGGSMAQASWRSSAGPGRDLPRRRSRRSGARPRSTRLPADFQALALRLIHSCGMPDILADLAWTRGRGRRAGAGRSRRARRSWSTRRWSRPASGASACRPPTRSSARSAMRARRRCAAALGTTRSAAAVELWRERLGGRGGRDRQRADRAVPPARAARRGRAGAGAGAGLPGRLRRRRRGQGGADRPAAGPRPTSPCAGGAAAARLAAAAVNALILEAP